MFGGRRVAELERDLKSTKERLLVAETKLDVYIRAFSKLSRLFNAMCAGLDVLGLLTKSTIVSNAIEQANAADAQPPSDAGKDC